MEAVREEVTGAVDRGLIIDGYVSHTGDDIAIVMSHACGENDTDIHQFAWNAFLKATDIAREYGLYGAGQDLLVDAPSGNVRGAGPAVAEIEFDHALENPRPAESFIGARGRQVRSRRLQPAAVPWLRRSHVLRWTDAAADDQGIHVPRDRHGQHRRRLDHRARRAEDYYRLTALLRDNERFGIDSIYSRTHDTKAAAVSAQRLHSIAGTYTGKDDPIAIIRNPGHFPGARGTRIAVRQGALCRRRCAGLHNMPLMPVAIDTAVAGVYCLPIVSCLGFSLSREGCFSDAVMDFFDNVAWDEVRRRAQNKGDEMRLQGWSGPAMLPYTELEYSGFRDTVTGLVDRFRIRRGYGGGRGGRVTGGPDTADRRPCREPPLRGRFYIGDRSTSLARVRSPGKYPGGGGRASGT